MSSDIQIPQMYHLVEFGCCVFSVYDNGNFGYAMMFERQKCEIPAKHNVLKISGNSGDINFGDMHILQCHSKTNNYPAT